jgi:hypothetical protein
MKLRVELRPTKGPAYEIECLAVLIGADNTLSAVDINGTLRLLATRTWETDVADRWFDTEGRRLRKPLIHGDPDADVLLHFDGRELTDGKKGPWTLFGYKHVPTLNLARHGDHSITPVFCVLMHRRVRDGIRPEMGWIKNTADPGVDSILLAPAGFAREILFNAASGPRARLSALAV